MPNSSLMRAAAALSALAPLLLSPARAADEDADAKLREALRRTTTELRASQDEAAAEQAKAAAAEQQRQAAATELAAVKQQLMQLQDTARAAQAKAAAADASAAQAASAAAQLQAAQTSLEKWQAAYKQAADVARARDADAKSLAATGAALDQRVKACESANAGLYATATEILDRYQHKGLGEVLADDEPFTQIARVKLENEAQDYTDKLRDDRIRPQN